MPGPSGKRSQKICVTLLKNLSSAREPARLCSTCTFPWRHGTFGTALKRYVVTQPTLPTRRDWERLIAGLLSLQAFRIDQPDLAARPYTSSILDDAFYVLRTVMTRILSTSSLKVVSDMFKMVRTVVEEDYIEVLVGKMENVWRSVSGSMTVDGPRKEAATREMRIVFAVSLSLRTPLRPQGIRS